MSLDETFGDEWKALVKISEHEGYGDVIAGVNILQYLQQEGIEPEVDFARKAEKRFETVAPDELKDSVEEWTDERKRTVSLTPVSDYRSDRQKERTDVSLRIEEYDFNTRGITRSNYLRSKLVLQAGLGFDSGIGDIQAGIYHDMDLQELLQQADEAEDAERFEERLRRETLRDVLDTHNPGAIPRIGRAIGLRDNAERAIRDHEDEIVDADWSFIYKSSIGTVNTFFDIVDAASDRLEEPLYLFAAGGPRYAVESAEERGWSVYSLSDGMVVERGWSPVRLVDVGTVPNQQFKRLNALSDSLSLVTGDQSMSQALQVSDSGLASPFLYQCANWKTRLADNLGRLMEETDGEAAALFNGYVRNSVGGLLAEEMITEEEHLARLLYDDELQERYTAALAGVEQRFVEERREAGIEEAELLWSVNDTIGYILEGLASRRTVHEVFDPLLPEEYRELFSCSAYDESMVGPGLPEPEEGLFDTAKEYAQQTINLLTGDSIHG